MAAEKIIELRIGEEAPEGWRIVRTLSVENRPIGVGTHYERVFTIVITTALLITEDVLPYRKTPSHLEEFSPDDKLARIKRICEGDSEGDHGYTGSELAEVILDVIEGTSGRL